MTSVQRRHQILRLGQAGLLGILFLLVTLVQGVQAEPERATVMAETSAVYTTFSGESGTVVQVSSGTFQVDTEHPVTFCGEWGALTIPRGEVLVELGISSLEVTVLRGSASVDTLFGETGLVLLAEGESRAWASPVLTTLGMSE